MTEYHRLERVEMFYFEGRPSFRFYWDNNYYQMITMRDDTPDGVIAALECAASMIRAAKHAGKV